MRFEQIPMIPKNAICRAAGVTPYYGNQVVAKLRDAGQISPQLTPTGYERLCVDDARVAFAAMTTA